MLSTVLVLGMLPGLAFFEAGLLNHKTTVSLFMQMFCGLSVLALMWIFVGYRFRSPFIVPSSFVCFLIPLAAWPSDPTRLPGSPAPSSATSTT
jgi:ammonia channel protein AmtB